ncbi:MAG: methylmalonyl-CoA mutase family protein [bacterium]
MTAQKLDDNFPTPDRSTWESLVAKTLAGKDLASLDHEIGGQRFSPIYAPTASTLRPRMAGTTALVAVPRPAEAISLLSQRYDRVHISADWTQAQCRATFRAQDVVHVDTHPKTGAFLDDAIGWISTVFHDPFLTGVSSVDEHHTLLGYVSLDGAAWELAGANATEELAAIGAGVLEGLRAGATSFHLRLALTPMVFESIAKRRALDAILGRIQQWHGTSFDDHVHGLTSIRTFSAYDPFTNILRSACSTAAGLIAGFDTLTAMPHDWRCATPSDGTRIAANLPHVLREESHLLRTWDAAGGSGYLEALTDGLARAAWELILDLERAGGLGAARETMFGRLQTNQAASARAVATRKTVLVGVNDFVDALEITALRQLHRPSESSDGLGDPFEPAFAGLGWEALARRAQGKAVGIVGVGELKRHKARRDYVERLLRAGGFSPEDSAEPHVVFLVGHDEDYPTDGLQQAKELTAAGHRVVVAGRPGELEAGWNQNGVSDFVYIGADVLAVLSQLLEAHP